MTPSSLPPSGLPGRRQWLLATTLGALAVHTWVLGQPRWPARPVVLTVPFPEGGGTDAFARPLATQLAKQTGIPFALDHQGGAGGTLGASLAARARPDGYSLFMGAVHHAIAPSIYPTLDYDLEKDFVPLVLLAHVPQVLVVGPRHAVGDFPAFLAQVRANPGRMSYASGGGGTSQHLAGELFKQQTHTFVTHIPYRGAGLALQDVMAGNVDMMFDGLGSSAPHIRAGRIKALMVSGPRRNPAFPQVPCAAELGLPDYTVVTWYGLWAPRATPAEVQARIVDEVHRATASEALKAAWASNGAEFGHLTPPQFAVFVGAEITRWAAVVKASGAKLD